MATSRNSRVPTGVAGLDEVLNGGFISHRTYLIRGVAGTGKTILGLHYLIEGVKNDESSLFITFSETEEEINQNVQALGLSTEGKENQNDRRT